MISSPMESQKTVVFADIRFITKFERVHPERGLGLVRIGDFRLSNQRISVSAIFIFTITLLDIFSFVGPIFVEIAEKKTKLE